MERKIRNSLRCRKKYLDWRQKVLERDNFKCQHLNCGFKDIGYEIKILRVHHIKSISTIIKEHNLMTWEDCLKCDELWDFDNAITYCEICHNEVHDLA